jgi:malate dehydrogenase (oxaloacetate-decarboxylating)(NADP+)
MESGVALNPIMDWDKYEEELLDRLGMTIKWFVRLITNRAKIDPKKIVFAEADHLDAKGSQIVLDEGIGQPILLGNMEIIIELKKELGFETVEIIDTKIFEEDERRNRFAIKYWETRKEEGSLIGCSKVNAKETILLQ